MGELIPILGILCAIGLPIVMVTYVLVSFIRSRNNERLEMIKSGVTLETPKKTPPNRYTMLRNAFLFIGIGAGALIGFQVSVRCNYEDIMAVVTTGGSTLLCLGLSYLVFFFVTKDKID